MRASPLLPVLVLLGTFWPAESLVGAGLSVVERTPSAVTVRIDNARPGQLYRVTYNDGDHQFVWENLSPDTSGLVCLTDDRHLRPQDRLRCESRLDREDPVVFDDLLKGPIVGSRRLQFGVPVSTFGGPGYLVPGVSDLKRDDFGNFWLYLDHRPYAIMKYGPGFEYEFALLMPDRVLAFDLDASGNLYTLHPGNWISRRGPLGEDLGAWELPFGRGRGEFASASGLVIDRKGGFVYVADEVLGRVQRFDLDLKPRPFPQTAWGWIGREDLAFAADGRYNQDTMYYQLDRPRQLRLDNRGHLFVSCEHYVSKFDLATGRQVPFGANPVLGWGGTFSDSPFSKSAALDAHWQLHWLAGVDESGNVYISDRQNDFLINPRLQVFGSDGVLVSSLSLDSGLTDAAGHPVYITAAAGIAIGENRVWVVDAAGRVYEAPPGGGIRSGGRLYLGAGAAGRQYDLGQCDETKFSVEPQAEPVRHTTEGLVASFPPGERGTGNCERERSATLKAGEPSMWIPTRLGEPFRVVLYDEAGLPVPERDYTIEYEETPGLFGTRFDYFRVINRSGADWKNVRFIATATG